MSDDRRNFFKKVAGGAVTLAGVEAVLAATGTTGKAGAALAADRRSFVAGRFALELDGVAALVQSVEGGDADDLHPRQGRRLLGVGQTRGSPAR